MSEVTNSDLLLAIGRLEGKMEGVLTAQSNTLSKIDAHGSRIGSLEGFRRWCLGGLAAIGAGLAYFKPFQ